jgi:hypothetical protein
VTRVRGSRGARKGGLLLLLSLAFLPFGVPRRLEHEPRPGTSRRADGGFSALCRDRGGTPRTIRARRLCTIRYGRRDYVMDAITAAGFDEDTAGYQRRGCDEARRAERAWSGPQHHGRSFVYHPATGVCERRG